MCHWTSLDRELHKGTSHKKGTAQKKFVTRLFFWDRSSFKFLVSFFTSILIVSATITVMQIDSEKVQGWFHIVDTEWISLYLQSCTSPGFHLVRFGNQWRRSHAFSYGCRSPRNGCWESAQGYMNETCLVVRYTRKKNSDSSFGMPRKSFRNGKQPCRSGFIFNWLRILTCPKIGGRCSAGLCQNDIGLKFVSDSMHEYLDH